MRRRKRNNRVFIIVAELSTRELKKIIRAPIEKKENIKAIDEALLEKAKALALVYPSTQFDIVISRTTDIGGLKDAFPEFSCWDRIAPEDLLLSA